MDEKKLISIAVPVYNEEAMIDEIYARVCAVMENLTEYRFEIVFFDDGSTDGTRFLIRSLCEKDKRVKAVFLSKNFGYSKNIFYSLQQSDGHAVVLLHADLQNPPEVIPEMIKEWESGKTAVIGVKNKSRENKLVYFIRTLFYLIMNRIFDMNLVPHATDFGLFDKSFCSLLKECRFANPFLRSIIKDYIATEKIKYINYIQDKRRKGKTKFTISKYYDFAVCGIVNNSKKLPRKFLVLGLICAAFSIIEIFANFIPGLVKGSVSDISGQLTMRLIFLLISLGAVFNSIIAEYIVNLPKGGSGAPLVTEEERINFDLE